MKRNVIKLVVSVVAMLTITQYLRAALVLEYDFRTAQDNDAAALNQASVTANDGSPDADLLGGTVGTPDRADIFDSSTALGAGYDPRIATGYLSVRPVSGAPDQALGTANTINGPDHLMKQYMGVTNFSTGSVVVVFKPQFTGIDTNRRTFFWHGTDNSSNNLLWLMNDDNVGQFGPSLRRNDNTPLVSLSDVSWDNNTWYMLAASWKSNLETDAENVMYLRALKPFGAALMSVEDDILVDGDVLNEMNQPIYLGRRGDSGEDSGNSDMALFQLYNNAMTLSDFNLLYNELALIPEPASAHLLLIGFVALGSRLRRRR